MTYKEKLLDPRWQKKRLEILSRDNFACFICGDTKSTLHVHHEDYEYGKDPWDVMDDCFLTTLCADCHSTQHLAKTPLEKWLLDCVRSRAKYDKRDMKMFNRVIKSVANGEMEM